MTGPDRSPPLACLAGIVVLTLLFAPQARGIDRAIVLGPDDTPYDYDEPAGPNPRLLDPWDRPAIDIDDLPPADCTAEGTFDVEPTADFQRVDGLTLGLVERLRGTGAHGPTLELSQRRALSRGRWLSEATLWQPLIPDRLRIGAGFFRRTAPFDGLDREIVSDEENLIAALVVKEDLRDYLEDQGVELHVRQEIRNDTRGGITLVRSSQRPLANSTRLSLTRWGERFRENPAASEGRLHAIRIHLEHDTRPGHPSPSHARWYRARWERAGGNLGGDFDYERLVLDVRNYVQTSPGQRLSWRALYGRTLNGVLPVQKRFAIGGIGTLRAHPFKSMNGENLLLGNVEYRFRVFSKSFALAFVDAGATADRGESITDQRFALDGGFGFAIDDDRAAIYFARDLHDPDAKIKVSFKLTPMF